MDSAELPRPPAHGKYDFHTNRPRQRKNGLIKCISISIVVIVLLGLAINAIILFLSLKKAKVPQFQVKNVQVSKFSVANVLTDQQKVLATDLDFFFESDNKSPFVGVDFGNMDMVATWDEIEAHLGETHVENYVQKTKGASTLKVTAKAEVEVHENVRKEDMKLNLYLSGDLKFFSGPFKTKTYPFLISCNNISSTSVNAVCDSKMFPDGNPVKIKPPVKPKKPAVSPSPSSAEGPVADPPSQDSVEPTDADEPSTGSPKAPTKVFSRKHLKPRTDSLSPPVTLTVQDTYVILDNGFLQANISKPAGHVTGIRYNGIDNILDTVNPEDDRGTWNVVWAPPGTKGTKGNFQRVVGKEFRVIIEREDQIELSFKMPYDPVKDDKKAAPMEVDQRHVMLRGVSGIYSYGIFERAAWPAFGMPNARLAFKLQRQQFRHMVINDNMQRDMPTPEDRLKPRGQQLAYPEAVLLVDPIEPEFKGEVDDKYQYSQESQDIRVHGWISRNPPTGFWQITPSYEFRSGGPNKQFLTSHVGPSTLAMFVSAHYSGEELIPRFKEGEPWNHIYGPIFMYMNNVTKDKDISLLWDDAKKKMLDEVRQWPYSFPASKDFPKANERVTVTGTFFVHDKYLSKEKEPAKNAFIGLGPPGEAGAWQRDCKTYQFWTRTDEQGKFTIPSVRVGSYDLHGFVDGFIGDFKHTTPIKISVGRNVDVGEVVFEPPRDGPTLWEIGIPDRLAKEFNIPDPNPKYVNKLYVNRPGDKFRQYGIWERYAELYPKDDLVYDVNASDYSKDWFYAQVTRQLGAKYSGTTWTVKFSLNDVVPDGIYKFRLALASATNSYLEVRFNKPKPSPPIFTTGSIGNDNSIARHGIHGLYWLYNIDVKGSELNKGDNTLYLTQTKGVSAFQGIMYDYLRLEGPPSSPK